MKRNQNCLRRKFHKELFALMSPYYSPKRLMYQQKYHFFLPNFSTFSPDFGISR